jgi:hypothetical protein
MKKTIVTVCSLLVAVGAFAQGQVNFNTRVGIGTPGAIDAPVFLADGVTKATGPTYLAQLFAGPTAAALTPAGVPVAFKSTPAALAGYIAGGTVNIPNIAPGGGASIQMVAWNGTLFATPALADAAGQLGKSGIITLAATGNDAAIPPTTPVNLAGLTGFNIPGGTPPIPEPSTLALAFAGGIGLLAYRRRK